MIRMVYAKRWCIIQLKLHIGFHDAIVRLEILVIALPEVMPQMSQQIPFGRGMMQSVGEVPLHKNGLSEWLLPSA